MNRTRTLLLLSALAAITAPGCLSTVIREGAGKVRGAKGIVAPVQPLASVNEYTRFELGAIQDDTGGKVPPAFLHALPRDWQENLADSRLPNVEGKTAVLRGRIVHYEDSGTLLAALSPLEEVICRTELVDKASGQVLGVANCVGRTTENVNRGPSKKADGLAKAFVSWIESGMRGR